MKKNIYLVQVDILRKSPRFHSAYLPYAAGALWAYARQMPAVAEAFALGELFFFREPAENAVARMEDPFLVGFSCYCWNMEYNKALARAVKEAFPHCQILFGGHNVSPGGEMLDELPYVDFLIHGEGEIPFQSLLAELCKPSPDYAAVPGLSYRTGRSTSTNAEAVLQSLEDSPSPFLEGVFAPLIQAHPEIQWCIVWETNRGCPYHCAYCDWGQHKAMVRKFSMERILAEVEWISANKVEFIWCADANFGILERDEEIVDALVTAHEQTGYPQVFLTQTTKRPNERLFRIFEKLCKSGLEKLGPNLAVQSLSPEVLRNIGREAFDEEMFSRWQRRYRQAGYRTHTDLILGLPGETLHSFCAGVEKLYTLGQHEGIIYYQCNLLPNAHMANPAFREKYGIRAKRKIFQQIMENTAETTRIDEYMVVVDETASMPHADWLTANYFMLLAQAAHGYGLLRLIAMFLHTEGIVSYAGFYLALLRFCREHPDTLVGNTMAYMMKTLGDEDPKMQIPGFSFGRMLADQYFFSRAVLEPDRFYAEIKMFLGQFDLEAAVLDQLLRYQRESILLPGAGASAAKTLDFGYDFPAYFRAIYDGGKIQLAQKAVRLRFSCGCDLSAAEKYYDTIVRLGRLSNAAFYATEQC